MKISYRAANAIDVQAMTRARGSLATNLALFTIPGSVVLFAGAYFLFRSLAMSCVVSAVFFAASAISNVRFFKKVKAIETNGNHSIVEVLEVEAFRVVEIDPLGSHGPAYCFFVDGGKALLLIGQWLLEQPSFPCSAFSLYCWSNTKVGIRIEPNSPRILPEQSPAQIRGTARIRDIIIFDGTPDSLQADMDRAFSENAA